MGPDPRAGASLADSLRGERLPWVVLGAGMATAAGLLLYLGRGTTFSIDELPG